MIVKEVQVRKGRKHWYWRLLGLNGRILATSEVYSSKRKALQTAEQVQMQILGVFLMVKSA